MELSQFSQPSTSEFVETQIVDRLLETTHACQGEEAFTFEQEEELYDSACSDEEFVPIYDAYHCSETNEFFSYEYICKVLVFKEAHPGWNFKPLQNQFERVEQPNYIVRFHDTAQRSEPTESVPCK